MPYADNQGALQPLPASTISDNDAFKNNPTTEPIAIGNIPINLQLLQQSQQLCNVIIRAKGGGTNLGIKDLLFNSI